MRQRTWISIAMTAVVSLAAVSGCGRLAPAGPKADEEEVVKVVKLFPVGEAAINDDEPDVQEATGTTTISGAFKLAKEDAIPSPRNITALIKGDLAVCLPDGKAVFSDALVIDPQSLGIAGVLVYMWTKNDSIGWSNVPAPEEAMALADDLDGSLAANQVEFDQEVCQFLTRVKPIQIGKTLKILNSDKTTHNTNITSIGSPNIPGEMFSLVKPLQETRYPLSVVCNIHPWMQAWLLPRTNAYFAVTDKDGKFEIRNVPTGVKLDFMVWHEMSAAPGKQLILDVDRPGIPNFQWTRKTTKGRIRITLAPDTPVVFGDIDVPLSALRP